MAARILIIDPDTATVQLMAGLLAARGHAPLTQRAAPLDLVLYGVAPGEDLDAAVAQLRADPLLAGVPLLALDRGAGAQSLVAAGFDGFLPMPLEPDSFAAEVEAFLLPGASVTGTVLVVDDDAFMLDILADLLSQEGYRVLSAPSGEQALAQLAREPVHVVLSDQWMPEMTGAELMAQVARLYPHTARLMLSAHAQAAEIAAAVAAGTVDRYYTKPWSGAELRDGIREAFALQRRRAGQG